MKESWIDTTLLERGTGDYETSNGGLAINRAKKFDTILQT